ncbi:MAG TPA: ATP-binding protein [Kofleriaceae bacterium]
MQLPIEQIIEAMVDVVVVVDPAGRIPLANAAAREVTGFSAEELATMSIATLLSDDSSGLHTPVRRRVENGEALRRSNAWLTTKAGDRIPVSVTAAAITEGEAARAIVLVVRDAREARALLAERDAEISRREEAERSLRRGLSSIEGRLEQTRAHLLLAERRASLWTLAAGVGSELRAIARRQRESLEVVGDLVLPDHAASALAELAHIGSDVDAHADRLYALAESADERARPLNLHRAIHDVVAMLQGAGTMRDHEIVYAFREPPVFVVVHRSRLELILVNLLVNAADALGTDRGRIMIAVDTKGTERARVEINDTGRGIPPEVLPHVFEPFFTTKPHKDNPGLGLAVVRQAVHSYGGQITASSTRGVGATFAFDLPRSRDDS